MKFKQMEAVFLSNGKSLVSAKDEGEHNSTGKCIHILISIWTLHTFRLSGHIRYGGRGDYLGTLLTGRGKDLF